MIDGYERIRDAVAILLAAGERFSAIWNEEAIACYPRQRLGHHGSTTENVAEV